MRAFVVTEYAHPTKISVKQDAPEPTPSKHQVVVEVYSAGMNFFDVSCGLVYQLHLSLLRNMSIDPASSRQVPASTPFPIRELSLGSFCVQFIHEVCRFWEPSLLGR